MREARAASALNHPNVITIYEIGEFERGRFIAMELVRGRTLRSLIGEPHANDEIARLGSQIARGLAVAHEVGIVHRDIKPENIMVRDDGYVKLLDFGIARLLSGKDARADEIGAALTGTGRIMGTLRYMSPEQASADAVDRSTDVFSLGLVLYELATGRHPFSGKSELALVTAIVTSFAPEPCLLNYRLSNELNALIMSALEKDPSRRPSAGDIDVILSHFLAGTQKHVVAAPPDTREIIGRESERRDLRAALDSASRGRSLVMCVTGEPGIGKTTLVDDFTSGMAGAKATCFMGRGRCSERLAGTEAYLPLLEALEGLLRGPADETLTALMKQHAPTWYLHLAGSLIGDSSERMALMHLHASSQERMKRELGAFFQESSKAKPIVLVFDDLHWADASTVDMMSYLATRFQAMRLLIVVTYRPSELLLTKHPFASLMLDLQSRSLCQEVQLDLLSAAQVAQYVAKEFPGNRFPESFSALLHSKTEGSPLFITDLLRYLRTRAIVATVDGAWALVKPLADVASELPESIRAMVQRKIGQLSEEDRRLLTAAAVEGYEFDSAVLATVTNSEAGVIEERLESLEHVYGFVLRTRERELGNGAVSVRYRFVHVLYSSALYAGLTPTRKATLSRLVAEALITHHTTSDGENAGTLAMLFETARDLQRATDYLLLASQNASRVFANEEAVLLARRGLELVVKLSDTPERRQKEMLLQVQLGLPLAATLGIGHPEVGKAFARAYDLWKVSGSRAELFAMPAALWGYYIVAARVDTALELASELFALAEDSRDKAMLVTACNALSITLHHAGDHEMARRRCDQGIAAYSVELSSTILSMPVEPGVTMLAESSRILWVLGFPDQALRRAEEAIAVSQKVTHSEARGFAPLFGALIHCLRGDAAQCLAYSEAVITVAKERDIATTLAWGMATHGWAVSRTGRLDEGIAEMVASLAAQREAGALIARTEFLAMLADAYIVGARYDDAITVVDEAMQLAASSGDHYWDSELMRLKSELLMLTGGQRGEAETLLRSSVEHARQRKAKSFELRSTISLSRMWAEQGRKSEARSALEDVYAWFNEGLETTDLVEARTLIEQWT